MVKRSKRDYGREIDKEDEEIIVAEVPKPKYNTKVRLQSRISALVIAYGPETGKRYVWSRSGAIVEVDEVDSTGLLEKRLGDKTCCGGHPDNLKLFIQVE